MALLPNAFVPSQTDESIFEVLPAGWVKASIKKSELKVTSDKKGKYISLKFVLEDNDDESSNGRIIFTNLNIINNNPTAVKIAEKDLKSICRACDLPVDDETWVLEDTEDLHDIPMWIKLSVKAETAQWPAKNEVKAYKHIDDDPNEIAED